MTIFHNTTTWIRIHTWIGIYIWIIIILSITHLLLANIIININIIIILSIIILSITILSITITILLIDYLLCTCKHIRVLLLTDLLVVCLFQHFTTLITILHLYLRFLILIQLLLLLLKLLFIFLLKLLLASFLRYTEHNLIVSMLHFILSFTRLKTTFPKHTLTFIRIIHLNVLIRQPDSIIAISRLLVRLPTQIWLYRRIDTHIIIFTIFLWFDGLYLHIIDPFVFDGLLINLILLLGDMIIVPVFTGLFCQINIIMLSFFLISILLNIRSSI